MATTLVRFSTWTGLERSVVVPSPNSPRELVPQAQTVPSSVSARLCQTPAAMAAPGPDGAILPERQLVPHARRNGDDMAQVPHLAGARTIGGRAVTQLARLVGAPGPDGAILRERQAVPPTPSKGGDIAQV